MNQPFIIDKFNFCVPIPVKCAYCLQFSNLGRDGNLIFDGKTGKKFFRYGFNDNTVASTNPLAIAIHGLINLGHHLARQAQAGRVIHAAGYAALTRPTRAARFGLNTVAPSPFAFATIPIRRRNLEPKVLGFTIPISAFLLTHPDIRCAGQI